MRKTFTLIWLSSAIAAAQTPTGGIVANTNAGPGFYVLGNSAIVFKNADGQEIFRVWATDPIDANYNTANLYVGFEAGLNQPTANNAGSGYYNTGLGFQALRAIQEGVANTAVGDGALLSLTGCAFNTAIGFLSLSTLNCDYYHGYDNVGLGASSLLFNQSGRENTALGTTALYYLTTGERNLAVGAHAGHSVTTGRYNVLIGTSLLPASYEQVTTGDHNLALGYNVAVPSQTASYQMNIANIIYGVNIDGEGQTVSTGNIGIGVKNPSEKLDVDGNVKASGLAGTGNAYACVDSSGKLFRSATPCN